jgi:hypothetical protein
MLALLHTAPAWRLSVDSRAAASFTYCAWPGVLCGGASGGDVLAVSLRGVGASGALPAIVGARLTSLAELDLAGNSYRGEVPPTWAGMRALTRLDVSGNALSGELPAALCARLRSFNGSGNDCLVDCRVARRRHVEALGHAATW